MKIILCFCTLAIAISSVNGVLCSNNNSLIFQYENVQKDCLWLRSASDEIRKELCAVDNISSNCNLSCGNCCSDNPFFRLRSDDDKTLSCFDIGKDDELKSLHCETKYGSSDFKVKDQCPESCDYCLNTQDETNNGSDEDEINIISATGDPNATSERKKKGRWVWPVFGSFIAIFAVVGSAFGYKKYKEKDAVKSQTSKSKFAAMFSKSRNKKEEEKKEEKEDDVEQGFFSGFFSSQPKEEMKEETGFFGGFFSQPPQEEAKKEEKQEGKKKFSKFFSKKNKNEI